MFVVTGRNATLTVLILTTAMQLARGRSGLRLREIPGYLIVFCNVIAARPHIEDELEELKPELGDVFSSTIPEGYFERNDLQGE